MQIVACDEHAHLVSTADAGHRIDCSSCSRLLIQDPALILQYYRALNDVIADSRHCFHFSLCQVLLHYYPAFATGTRNKSCTDTCDVACLCPVGTHTVLKSGVALTHEHLLLGSDCFLTVKRALSPLLLFFNIVPAVFCTEYSSALPDESIFPHQNGQGGDRQMWDITSHASCDSRS
jgi:hypothetical protein